MINDAAAGRICLQTRRFIYFEREEHGEELQLVSDQHGVADDGHLVLQRLLDGNRRDVLAAGSDDQLCAETTKFRSPVVWFSPQSLHYLC